MHVAWASIEPETPEQEVSSLLLSKRLALLLPARDWLYCLFKIALPQYSTLSVVNILLTLNKWCSLLLHGWCQGDVLQCCAYLFPRRCIVWQASFYESGHSLCAVSHRLSILYFQCCRLLSLRRDDDAAKDACLFCPRSPMKKPDCIGNDQTRDHGRAEFYSAEEKSTSVASY